MTEPTPRKTAAARTKASTSGDHAPEQSGPPSAETAKASAQRLGAEKAPDRSAAALLAKLPRYQRIAADLRARIESGELAPGQALPSETQMLTEYGVSRVTIRHAIADLRASGLVTTEHGRATRVRPNVGIALTDVFEFNPSITRTPEGFRTWDTDGWANVEPPSHYRTEAGRYASRLGLVPAEPVFVLERRLLHTADIQVMHRVFIPFATAVNTPGLEQDPFRPPAELYQVLADSGLALHWHDTTSAVMPAPDEAANLNIADGVPLLVHVRITTEDAARPLTLEEVRLPADRAIIGNQNPGLRP
jgi:GntR family transcriptional regulator